MGGWGSGWQWARRRTVNEARSIDALWYHRTGLLTVQIRPYIAPVIRDGQSFEWRGTSLVAYQGGTALISPLGHFILIDRTPCQFGGTRPWFRCPSCGRRSRFLYEMGSTYICRLCSRLTYASCQRTRDFISESQRAEEKYPELEGKFKRARSSRTKDKLCRRMNRLVAIQEQGIAGLWAFINKHTSKPS